MTEKPNSLQKQVSSAFSFYNPYAEIQIKSEEVKTESDGDAKNVWSNQNNPISFIIWPTSSFYMWNCMDLISKSFGSINSTGNFSA